jgi:hypothetical protein
MGYVNAGWKGLTTVTSLPAKSLTSSGLRTSPASAKRTYVNQFLHLPSLRDKASFESQTHSSRSDIFVCCDGVKSAPNDLGKGSCFSSMPSERH